MAELMKEAFREPAVYWLVRCQRTQRYFQDEDWTSDPGEGRRFADPLEVLRACVEHDLHEVELVLRSPADGSDVFCSPVR